jgi:hypothetical protein
VLEVENLEQIRYVFVEREWGQEFGLVEAFAAL